MNLKSSELLIYETKRMKTPYWNRAIVCYCFINEINPVRAVWVANVSKFKLPYCTEVTGIMLYQLSTELMIQKE